MEATLSRQRKWQIKMTKQGRCLICGKRAKTKYHCAKHAKAHTINVLKSQGYTRRTKDSKYGQAGEKL